MSLFEDRLILSVSELNRVIKGVIEENFSHLWVRGEVSNFAAAASGHCYLTLKDESSQIRSVIFRGVAQSLRFSLKDGIACIARGRLSLYEPRGEYQLVIEYIEPAGIGALQLAFSQLKEKLFKEGLFDDARKKPIPQFPQRIAVVTSPVGAAIHDIITVLTRRGAAADLLLYPVRVQGDGAAEEIAEAIKDLNRLDAADVIIAGRGGGSLEDLWAFNEEVVARAIVSSGIPVISAVGHEIDVTIADFAADLRAPTPSAAAEMVVKSSIEYMDKIESLKLRLCNAAKIRVENSKGRFESADRLLKNPSYIIQSFEQRVDDLSKRLSVSFSLLSQLNRNRYNTASQRLYTLSPSINIQKCRDQVNLLLDSMQSSHFAVTSSLKERVASLSGRLQGLSPLSALSRGFSIVTKKGSTSPVNDSSDIREGELLDIRFHKGGARCTVLEISDSIFKES